MMTRNVQAYEVQVSKVFGKVKVASRHAWLAGLGAIAQVQRQAPGVYASLVREGEQFEGRAVRSAKKMVNAMKSSRGFETVEKAARTYQRKLRKAYVETTAAVRPQAKAAAAKPAAAKRAVTRTARTAARRVKRAA
jgi:poly(hydroxyalkanoate) granule-associated protein